MTTSRCLSGRHVDAGATPESAGVALTAGAAVAAPPESDTVGSVDERLDGAQREQHSAAVVGAIDIEHAAHGTG
jgi:hypothetical protein